MVEASVELLASIAVTVLLMLIFLGVVVAWDIALALRDVAEKIDSLEDDVDEDLGKVDGTLTRIHDRMSEVAAAQQKQFEGARSAQSEYPQGDFGGVAGRQNAPHGQAMNAQSPFGARSSTRASDPGRTHNSIGVGAPSRRSVGASVGRTGKSQWSPDGPIGSFQIADRTMTRKEADSHGLDASTVGDVSAEDADEAEDDAEDADGAKDADDAEDADGAKDADDAATEADTEGEQGDDSASTEDRTGEDRPGEDDGPVEDGAVAGDSDDEAAANDSAIEDPAEVSDGEASESPGADVTDRAEGAVGGLEVDSGAAEAGEDSDETAVANDGATDTEEGDGDTATDTDDDSAEEIRPDRSAARAVQNFGRDARTNRRFGRDSTGGQAVQTGKQDAPDGVESAETDAQPADEDPTDDVDTQLDSPEASATPSDGDSNVGRFETDAEEPWYRTPLTKPGTADTDEEARTEHDGETEPSESVGAADDSGTTHASSDGGTVAASDGVESVEAAAATALTEVDTGEHDEPDVPTETDSAPDSESEEEADDAGDRGIADLVNQELNSLTQEVGGTSISPDVSEMPLQQATEELDDTSYAFPLSGQAFEVTATAEREVVTLRFTPGDDLDLGGARERLLRYQLRNYLDDADTRHAEVLVDDGDLVLEIPGATPESLDSWVDAMIQIVDRTLYLTGSDD
ncbi:hypothetical protein [Haloarchaeobius sp. DYHT-AS-18]|uniref:hypothetical protein n=1 Tax=Haloarchaeobius sp. DYHT-AS-18 TaxID=3446117 RepID=UPI003EBE68A8